MKSLQIRSFFLVRIQSECGKIWTRKKHRIIASSPQLFTNWLLNVQSCKLYNNKYLIASAQMKNTELIQYNDWLYLDFFQQLLNDGILFNKRYCMHLFIKILRFFHFTAFPQYEVRIWGPSDFVGSTDNYVYLKSCTLIFFNNAKLLIFKVSTLPWLSFFKVSLKKFLKWKRLGGQINFDAWYYLRYICVFSTRKKT